MSEQRAGDFQGFAPSGSTLCPCCDYDLRGLPVEYSCPECGLAYGKETMVWTGRVHRGDTVVKLGVAIFFLIVLNILGPAVSAWKWAAMTCVYVAMVAYYGWLMYHKISQRAFLAITGDEIICDGKDARRVHVALQHIDPINIKSHRRYFTLNRFHITYELLKTIDVRPFAKTTRDRIEVMKKIEDHRRKRLGLEPIQS